MRIRLGSLLPLALLATASAAAQSSTPQPQMQPDLRRSVIERDAEPLIELFRHGDFSLQLGALMQVQGAFYVGDQAAIQNWDPADKAGFRVRRTRFGFGGTLLKDVSFYFAVDLKDAVLAATGGDQGAEILDAHLVWSPSEHLQLTFGVDKVPLSLSMMQSSGRLDLIERALSVDLLAPVRRVGLSVAGSVRTGTFGRLRYAAGLFNASEGVTSGNRLAGLAGVGYLQYDLLGSNDFVPKDFGVTVGGAYMYDDGPALTSHRLAGNLALYGFRTRLQAEVLSEKSSPKEAPTTTPAAGDVTRWGFNALLTHFVFRDRIQLAARAEYFVDSNVLPTFGKQLLVTGGVNWFIKGHSLKLQLNYLHRRELDGPTVPNDAAFLQVQAMF